MAGKVWEFDSYGGLSNVWGAATNFGGSDSSFVTPRIDDTVPTNALQSMQPVSNGDSSASSGWGSGWGEFLQKTLGTAIGYSLQKDAMQSGVKPGYVNGQIAPVYAANSAADQRQQGGLMQLLLIGGGIFLLMKVAK